MRTRKGFTLVELLVLVAVIAVLTALILPAIQAARRKVEAKAVVMAPQPIVIKPRPEVAKPIDRVVSGNGDIVSEVIMIDGCKWVMTYRPRSVDGPVEMNHAFNCGCWRKRGDDPVIIEAP